MKIYESQMLLVPQIKLGRTKLNFCNLKTHFWSPQIPQNLRSYVDDLICRDLRTIGGTSLDHKFLFGGPKSIHTTGNPGVTVKLGKLSEKKQEKVGKLLIL